MPMPITTLAEMEMGQWVKWVTIFGWVTWVTASDPLTHDDEITAQ